MAKTTDYIECAKRHDGDDDDRDDHGDHNDHDDHDDHHHNCQKGMKETGNRTRGKGRVNGKNMLYPAENYSTNTMSKSNLV